MNVIKIVSVVNDGGEQMRKRIVWWSERKAEQEIESDEDGRTKLE